MMSISIEAQKLAEADLHAAGIRMTSARVKVLAALISARCALSHQDILSVAKIDRVTLYRALASLTEAGLAHKIAGDDRISRYGATSKQAGNGVEYPARKALPHQRTRQHSHGHFQCTLCMRVFCLDSNPDSGLLEELFLMSRKNKINIAPEPLQDILHNTLGSGFRSHDIELIVKGWCADCAH